MTYTFTEIVATQVARFDSGAGEAGSEVVAHENGLLYVTNGAEDRIDIFGIASQTLVASLDLSGLDGYGGVNSVAVKNGLIAVAYEGADELGVPQPGGIALFDARTHKLIGTIETGFLPDMVTFSADGSQIYVANEGEPGDGVDPQGSVTIIDIAAHGHKLSATTIDFTAFDGQEDALRALGIRIFPGNSASADFEPEYIAIDPVTGNLLVTLQENNAVAVIDPVSKEILELRPLGTKDHALAGNGLDPVDDGTIDIQPHEVQGIRMADAIASFQIGGQTYYATANEGDDRGDFDEGGDAARVKDILDGDVFVYGTDDQVLTFDASVDTTGLERLNISIVDGDTDGDGDIDVLHSYGSRSFTIYDTDGNIVFDSGDAFEQIIAQIAPDRFNDDDSNFDEDRSDNKGPEPEAIAIGQIGDNTYAFIGLERDSGIMVYNVSDPANAYFVTYIDGIAGNDVSPEVITFIAPEDSTTGKPQIAVAYEISGTTVVYDLDLTLIEGTGGRDRLEGTAFADTIDGGAGDDQLQGGAGGDRFVFGDGDGHDRISDFEDGADLIDLAGVAGVADFGDLEIKTSGKVTTIDYGTGSVMLVGVAGGDIDAADFVFA